MTRFSVMLRLRIHRAALSLLASMSLLAGWGAAPAFAQGVMRTPNLNVSSRLPNLDRTPQIRINPNLAGRAVTGLDGNSIRIQPSCTAAARDSGACSGPAGSGNSNGKSRNKTARGSPDVSPGSHANEFIAEIDGTLSDAQVDALARRHGLRRVESLNFSLIGATLGLFRIIGGSSLEARSRDFAQDGSVRSVQPNFRHVLQDQNQDPSDQLNEGDPAQYALTRLHLPQAHTLAHGVNVTIAVIDSAVDLKHPEFSSAAITNFDALGSKEGPHAHGTAVAGAIVSQARLMGSAPAARILAIRAFGGTGKSAESTSYVLLKALEHAAVQGARIVNMSFAGPKDALVARGLDAFAARGVVLVAAAGNAGPKSPPLYPGADAHVIAVSATDAADGLFAASNRGNYIAVAAPGADIFLPVPDGQYKFNSGTSFSAAYVSGVAALILERNPRLKPEEVKAILMKTARDLGPPGPDDQFGAGEADAFAAVSAVSTPAFTVAPEKGAATEPSNSPEMATIRENIPAASAEPPKNP